MVVANQTALAGLRSAAVVVLLLPLVAKSAGQGAACSSTAGGGSKVESEEEILQHNKPSSQCPCWRQSHSEEIPRPPSQQSAMCQTPLSPRTSFVVPASEMEEIQRLVEAVAAQYPARRASSPEAANAGDKRQSLSPEAVVLEEQEERPPQ